jgi:hypothetical protein
MLPDGSGEPSYMREGFHCGSGPCKQLREFGKREENVTPIPLPLYR